MGLERLKQVFEPNTREKAGNKQHLLIADNYGSHIRADFITHYIKNAIDLLIIPPYYSHLLQPLDIEIFTAFKRAHSGKTNAISRLSI